MFDSQTRYLTCGIQSEMPPEMQMCLWNSIDRQLSMNLPLDYLQVFKFEVLPDLLTETLEEDDINETA